LFSDYVWSITFIYTFPSENNPTKMTISAIYFATNITTPNDQMRKLSIVEQSDNAIDVNIQK